MNIETAKQTVKVLQPPGGGSSNIFGGPEITQPKKASTHLKSSVFGGDDKVPVSPKTSAARAGETQDRLFGNKNPEANPAVKDYNRSNIFEEATTDVSATPKQAGQNDDETDSDDEDEKKETEEQNNNNIPISETRQTPQPKQYRASFNPITGQSAEDKVESPTIRPSSRVRQPPGGASSKLW